MLLPGLPRAFLIALVLLVIGPGLSACERGCPIQWQPCLMHGFMGAEMQPNVGVAMAAAWKPKRGP